MSQSLVVELRETGRKLLETLEWQPIADSPTVKSYTDWRLFNKALSLPDAIPQEELPGDGWRSLCSLPATRPRLLAPEESKLVAAHYARLASPPRLLRLENGGAEKVSLCRSSDGWLSQHLVVEVPENTEAELLVYVPPHNGTSAVEIVLHHGSRLRLGLVSDSARAVKATMVRARVEAGARLRTAVLAGGGLQARVEEFYMLVEPGSSLDARSLSIARGEERADHIMDIVQDAERSNATGVVEAVALDSALAVARGTATVTGKARLSRSLFEANTLILGENAKGYTAPMMVINTGDVEAASHHAAQHSIPGDVLYYLTTRGLSPEEARSLILRGLIDKVIERLETLREEAQKLAIHTASL